MRVLAIPIGVARGYPPAVAADYARQTFRGRGRTMWSALYDTSVLQELEMVHALDGSLPILVEHADEDRTVPLSAHTKWSELLPSAEHRIVHGGHQVQLHQRFAPLAEWLGRLTG